METALLLIGIAGIGIFLRFIARQNREVIELLEKIREDGAVTKQPIRSPNRLQKPNSDVVSFDENNPLSIPRDVKFEIEGGDMTEPYEYANA